MAFFSRAIQHVLVAFVSALLLYPLYILFLISFSPVEFTLGSLRPLQWPGGFTLQNLVQAIQGTNLVDPTMRSLMTASLVGVITLLFGIPAAYGLSKLPNNLSNMISALLFLVNMIPALVIAIPISVSFITLHLYNTILGLALAQGLVALPFTIFLLLGAFQSLPKDLENQARVDGAGMLRTLYTLLVPLSKSAVAAAFLISWMLSWDEFTFAVILSPINPTLPIIIYTNITRGNILASSSFALVLTLPVVILTIMLQRYLKGEYLSGGLHG
ncbi:carbohydrate ABC transporter permease [Candidatus Bathyarchaeota archaeon]|nr:MAG: carbohydrate ABC transporter permease [Candidatus Bathyarchaeota archaeon]